MAVEAEPSVEVRRKLTPDDVCEMLQSGELDRDLFFELIDGEVIELAPSYGEQSLAGVKLIVPLELFARVHGGRVFESSAGFMVGADRKQLRAPDVAYIGPGRVQPSYPRFIDGAPDLAVEVLSEDQYGQAYARSKIREYFEAGARLVWLVDTRHREVRVYRPGAGEYTIVRGDGLLSLEPIISGFSLTAADIFR